MGREANSRCQPARVSSQGVDKEVEEQREEDSPLSARRAMNHSNLKLSAAWPLTPTSWRRARVPSTHDVSKRILDVHRGIVCESGSTKISRRELTKKTSAPHRTPPWQTPSRKEISGPMWKWTNGSKSLKQHDERGGALVCGETGVASFATELEPRPKTRLKRPSKARCHQGTGTLNKEKCTLSRPTAESSKTSRPRRNSERLNGPSKDQVRPPPLRRTPHQKTLGLCCPD